MYVQDPRKWLVASLAEHAPLTPYGVEVLLNRGNGNQVVKNDHVRAEQLLSPEQWRKLFKAAQAHTASELVRRPLTAELVEVAMKDKRVQVMESLAESNPLPIDQVLASSGKAGDRLCRILLELWREHDLVSSAYTVNEVALLALRAGGMDAVYWGSYLTTGQRQELARQTFAALEVASTPRRIKMSAALRDIVALYPELAGIAVETGPVSTSAVAGVASIGDREVQTAMRDLMLASWPSEQVRFGLLRFISAPRTPLELLGAVEQRCKDTTIRSSIDRRFSRSDLPQIECSFDKVSDAETLKWLIKRATPFARYGKSPSPAKRDELFLLATNDTCRNDDSLGGGVRAGLTAARSTGTLSPREFKASMAALKTRTDFDIGFLITVERCFSGPLYREVMERDADPRTVISGFKPVPAADDDQRRSSEHPHVSTADLPEELLSCPVSEIPRHIFLVKTANNPYSLEAKLSVVFTWLVERMLENGLDTTSHWETLVGLFENGTPVSLRDVPDLLAVL